MSAARVREPVLEMVLDEMMIAAREGCWSQESYEAEANALSGPSCGSGRRAQPLPLADSLLPIGSSALSHKK